jgi:hypothetical protein
VTDVALTATAGVTAPETRARAQPAVIGIAYRTDCEEKRTVGDAASEACGVGARLTNLTNAVTAFCDPKEKYQQQQATAGEQIPSTSTR